jgi:purine nucleosidase
MKIGTLLFFILMSLPSMASERRHLIIDQDADMDDLAAIAIAHLSKQFQIDAITICPADSLKASAIQITVALVKFLGIKNVQIAASDNEGPNPFPRKWRRESVRMAEIPDLQLPETEFLNFGFSSVPAAKKLAELLSGKVKYEILETGPLSNIADALAINPLIAKNISKIYFMGGALHVPGNVSLPDHDGTAEWNVYNNPSAFSKVLKAGIPLILVSLDATNKVPVTKNFMSALKQQDSYKVSHLFHQIWSVMEAQIGTPNHQTTYFFWDSLTAAFAANSGLASLRPVKIQVLLKGKSEGRTVVDPQGLPVQFVVEPKPDKFQKFILSNLKN